MRIPPRVNLVTLGVHDIARARAFYEALGWEAAAGSSSAEVAFFRTGGAIVALFGHDALAADAHLPASPPAPFRGVSLAINLPTEADVTAALAAAEEAGATILKPAERVHWGGFSGYFADPDGHVWEVAHNPYFPLDESGAVRLP